MACEGRRLAIGDIHGREFWKKFAEEDFDEFYILGDYFDSYEYSFMEEYRNFKEIVKTARADPRFKLCLGNHDYHYLNSIPSFERYSRFDSLHSGKINEALEEAMDLFKIVYECEACGRGEDGAPGGGEFLISHAGVSNSFMRLNRIENALDINNRFARDRTILRFNGKDVYGNDKNQGPLWIRPPSLCADSPGGFSQIVGHTPVEKITQKIISGGGHGGTPRRLIFIDTFETPSALRF